jgi:hypothetical protein
MLKYLSIFFLISLSSCGSLPQLINTAEHIADDEAIQIKVSQEALQRQTNVKAYVELDNGQLAK